MTKPSEEKRSHWPISILSSIASLLNMATPLVLVRILTPEEVGRFKIFFLYLMIVPAFSFTSGIVNGLAYWAGRRDQRDMAVRTSSALILGLAFLFSAAVGLLHGPLSHILHWTESETLVFALALFGAIASTFYEEAAIATGSIWRGALFNAGFEFLRTFILVGVALYTRSLMALFVTHSLIITLRVGIGYFLGYRQGLVGWKWDSGALSSVWKYASPVSLAWALGVLINYADQVILSAFIPSDAFAFYTVGCLSVPPLIILEHSITRVLIPQLSEAFADGKDARASALFRKAVEELSFLLIPAVTGMIVFARPIIELLFTSRYAASAQYLPFFAFSYLALIMPYDSVPRARGQSGWIFRNFVSFSLLTVALCAVLTYAFNRFGMGPFGALAGLLLSRAAMRGYAIVYLRRSTGWELGKFLPLGALARFTGISAALALLCLAARPLFPGERTWFLVCGATFAVAYLVLALRWKNQLVRREAPTYRILMLTQYLGIGGLERMILNLSQRLSTQGKWTPSVFVFDHDHSITPENHLGGSFAELKIPVELYSKGRGFSFAAVLAISRNILRNDIQVLHTHDLGALIYGVCAKLALLGKVKLVHTQHSFVHLGRKRRYQLYERFFTFFADELVVVSEDTRKTYLELGVDTRKVHVVGNGVCFPPDPIAGREQKVARRKDALDSSPLRESALRKELEAAREEFWVLYMARLHGRKGQDHGIRLWSELDPAVRGKLRLIFVGAETERGQLENLERLRSQAPDRERISYLGPSQVPAVWLECADLYLSCSEFEGMPLGPVEAAGAGLPLLLSRIPGHELLSELSQQYALEAPNLGAAALASLYLQWNNEGNDFYRRLWARAEELRRRFSLEEMARRYAGLYEEKTS